MDSAPYIEWAKRELEDVIAIEPEAHGDQSTVFHIETPSQKYILKIAAGLGREHERSVWLQGKIPVSQVISFITIRNSDALLTTELPGKNLAKFKAEWSGDFIATKLAMALRSFHSIETTACPFGTAGQGKVLAHGDACLPNFIFNEEELTGYVDLGDVGIDYPEVDLSAAVWSLEYNLGPGYGEIFLREYGYGEPTEEKVGELKLQYEQKQREWGLS